MAMEDTKLILRHLESLHAATGSLKPSLDKLLSTSIIDQLNQSSSAKDTIKLANGSAYLLVSLCFAYLKSQGVDTAKHPIMEDLNRVRSYMKRQSQLDQKAEQLQEKDDEETSRAREFIKSALGNSTVVTGEVGPAISFQGTHTKFEEKETGDASDEEEDQKVKLEEEKSSETVSKIVGDKIRKDKKKRKVSKKIKKDRVSK